MAYVIAEPCAGACHGECVAVCPVDCIHGPFPDRLQRYIDPETCTSCGACAAECPVEAIYDEDELPERWASYRLANAEAVSRRASRG